MSNSIVTVSITALRGKVACSPGVKECHKVTECNKPHPNEEMYWERYKRVGGFLCSVEKQLGAERETGFIWGFLGAVFSRVVLSLGQAEGLVGS